jgi:hypothetical protein
MNASPCRPSELRAKKVGHVVVNSALDQAVVGATLPLEPRGGSRTRDLLITKSITAPTNVTSHDLSSTDRVETAILLPEPCSKQERGAYVGPREP